MLFHGAASGEKGLFAGNFKTYGFDQLVGRLSSSLDFRGEFLSDEKHYDLMWTLDYQF